MKFVCKFKHLISLDDLRAEPDLEDMLVLRKGSRLSVTPVDAAHWEKIMNMAEQEGI